MKKELTKQAVKQQVQTYPIDWLDEALNGAPVTPRFTPYIVCTCGCGNHATPEGAYWFGSEPFMSKRHVTNLYEGAFEL